VCAKLPALLYTAAPAAETHGRGGFDDEIVEKSKNPANRQPLFGACRGGAIDVFDCMGCVHGFYAGGGCGRRGWSLRWINLESSG
jgi:hypothetical protein